MAFPTAGSGIHVYSTGRQEPSRHRIVVHAAHTGLPVDSTCVTGRAAWAVSGMTSQHANRSWSAIPPQAVSLHPRRRSASVFKDRIRPAESTVHMPRGSAWSSACVAATSVSMSGVEGERWVCIRSRYFLKNRWRCHTLLPRAPAHHESFGRAHQRQEPRGRKSQAWHSADGSGPRGCTPPVVTLSQG